MKHPRRGVPALPVDALRDGVAREAARVSLRQAAREIGTSPNGLRNFLNGASPRLVTRSKLEHWLARKTVPSRPPAIGQLVALMESLAADLSPKQTLALTRGVAALLESAYEERRLAAPKWVHDLSNHTEVASPRRSESVA